MMSPLVMKTTESIKTTEKQAVPQLFAIPLIFIFMFHSCAPPQAAPQPPQKAVIACLGDICLGRWVQTTHDDLRIAPETALAALKPLFADANLTIANLECAITNHTIPCRTPKGGPLYHFRGRPEMVKVLTGAGIGCVTLANNHFGDFGVLGMEETMTILRQNKIQFFGAGKGAAASTPLTISAGGMKLAFLAYCEIGPREFESGPRKTGTAWLTEENITAGIAAAKAAGADFIVVWPHWGAEQTHTPPCRVVDLGRRIIELGADVIMGCHSHTLQGCEFYKGGLICYSMGNALFDMRDLNLRESAVFVVTLEKSGGAKKISLDRKPVLIDRKTCTASPLCGMDAQRLQAKMANYDNRVKPTGLKK